MHPRPHATPVEPCSGPVSDGQSHGISAAQAAADHSATRLDEYATQAVSNIVWGCATMDFYHDNFIEAAAADITSASCFLWRPCCVRICTAPASASAGNCSKWHHLWSVRDQKGVAFA